MSKTTTVASVNGPAAASDDPCGITVLRGKEVKSLVSLACDALSETHEVSHRLHRVIYKRDAQEGAGELRRMLADALACLATTEHYMRMLGSVIDEQANGAVDPYIGEYSSPF